MVVIFRVFVVFLISIAAEAQIGAKMQSGKIYGIWLNSQSGYQMSLLLNTDGSGEFDGEKISFKTQGNILTLTQGSVSTGYSFLLVENALTLWGGDLDGKITFSRNEPAPENKSNAKADVSTRPSIDRDDVKDIHGVWSGNGETIEFRDDGNCIYLANSFPYQLSNGRVTLMTGQGSLAFDYSIVGNQLTLNGASGKAVYKKGASTSDKDGAGSVAPELIGRWQWINVSASNSSSSSSSRYVVFFANGTYEYGSESSRSVNTESLAGGTSSQDSDRGTWTVQGDRLYYHSQKQGAGSYSLQKKNHPKTGDPMIIIDGQSFVTSTVRSPWK